MKFKIPERFKIWGLLFRVKHVVKCSNDDKDDVDGFSVYSKNLIELKIDNTIPLDYKEFVFCHEWVHHIFNATGYYKLAKDELLVDRFAAALHQSIKTME
jgi:hypothetical protein